MRISTGKTEAIAAVSGIALLALWGISAMWVGKDIFLPGPAATWAALLRLAGARGFWTHISSSLVRGLTGFGVSYAAGLVFGIAAGASSGFDAMFRPLLVAVRTAPFMALTVLALIWFRSDTVPVFVTFLLVFPVVAQNVIEGIRSIDPALLSMARLYRVRTSRILGELCIPAILPYLAAGAAAGLGLTWKATVSAEVLANPRWGIGTQMDRARVLLDTPAVFAWTIIVIIIGLAFDRAVGVALEKRLFRWK